MAVGFIRFDLRIRLSLRFKELKLMTQINISTSKTFNESLQSGHAEILSVFPVPIWNFELNIFMTICIKVFNFERG